MYFITHLFPTFLVEANSTAIPPDEDVTYPDDGNTVTLSYEELLNISGSIADLIAEIEEVTGRTVVDVNVVDPFVGTPGKCILS